MLTDDIPEESEQGGEELWPLPGKSPAMLRVHNIPKKVHTVADIFPLYFERQSKETHSICFSSCETEENAGKTLLTISISLQISSDAKNTNDLSQVNSWM